MTDTHCHLSFTQYNADREVVLRRATAAGVTRLVNPGTDLAQSRAAVALARMFPAAVRAGIGTHPQDVAELSESTFGEFEVLARTLEVVAIGEVGLERSARSPALDLQRTWLARFVTLAEAVGKPLLFHVRDAHAEFRRFLEEYMPLPPSPGGAERGRIKGVVHCFSGTVDDAAFYTRRGLFLGITGIVTFPNAHALRDIVREMPLEHFLLETDAPFLAPQSRRGTRNEPAFLHEVAETVGAVKGIPRAEVERQTDAHASQLFFAEEA